MANYTPHVWSTGDVITATLLNALENAVGTAWQMESASHNVALASEWVLATYQRDGVNVLRWVFLAASNELCLQRWTGTAWSTVQKWKPAGGAEFLENVTCTQTITAADFQKLDGSPVGSPLLDPVFWMLKTR